MRAPRYLLALGARARAVLIRRPRYVPPTVSGFRRTSGLLRRHQAGLDLCLDCSWRDHASQVSEGGASNPSPVRTR